MTAPDAARVKELRGQLSRWQELRDPYDLTIGRIYADLLAILDSFDALPALQAENERLQVAIGKERDQVEKAEAENAALKAVLTELQAIIKGECHGLLRESSGGVEIGMMIDAALAARGVVGIEIEAHQANADSPPIKTVIVRPDAAREGKEEK